MKTMKKAGICTAVIAGAAGIAGITAIAADKVKKNAFDRGFETGHFLGFMDVAQGFAKKHSTLLEKYNALVNDYEELEDEYSELCEASDNKD